MWALIDTAFSVVWSGRESVARATSCGVRQRVNDLGRASWFQPSVTVQQPRSDRTAAGRGPGHAAAATCCTVTWAVARGLATDKQHWGMCFTWRTRGACRSRRALAMSNRLQTSLCRARVGANGHRDLGRRSRKRSDGIEDGIHPPIGVHGHGAGPLIGSVGLSEGVPVAAIKVIPGMWFRSSCRHVGGAGMVRASACGRGRGGCDRRGRWYCFVGRCGDKTELHG